MNLKNLLNFFAEFTIELKTNELFSNFRNLVENIINENTTEIRTSHTAPYSSQKVQAYHDAILLLLC